MVQLREILDKLGPNLGFSDKLLDYDIGDYDFDIVKQTGIFSHEYTNSNNPNIKLRIKDDFPLRFVVFEKKEDVVYGTTFNGSEEIKWKRENERFEEI